MLLSSPALAGPPPGFDGESTSLRLAAKDGEADDSSDGGGGVQIGLSARSGLAASYVSSDPNFFGGGAVAEGTIRFADRFGLGFRLDGQALFGINLGDNVEGGVRAIVGTLAKAEYQLLGGPVRPMIGLAGGRYAVAIAGASVGNQDDVGAIAGGGVAYGIAPQGGIDIGGFRIAVVPHLLFVGERVDPIWTLELSWEAFKLDF